MILVQANLEPVQPDDNSSVSTAFTSSEAMSADLANDNDVYSLSAPYTDSQWIPEPGSTFQIRSVSTGDIITQHKDQVLLKQQDNLCCAVWECVVTNGWYGFVNHCTGKYLGRDEQWKWSRGGKWRLYCANGWHRGWEKFRIISGPEGHVLQMTEWFGMYPVGIGQKDGLEKLVMFEDGNPKHFLWEFVRV